MNRSFKAFLLVLVTFLICSTSTVAQISTGNGQNKTLDRIVAVVNDHTILKSEVDRTVTQQLIQARQQQQNIQFSKELWYSALNSMVENYVMLDKAREDSITVTDDQVEQMLDQRINRVVNQLGSQEAVEQQMGQSIIQLRADLRTRIREQLIIQKFQQQFVQDIQITRPEVKQYLEQIPQDSLPTIPEQVAVSQIVRIPPPLENAEKEALQLARQLRDSLLNHSKSIEELARRHSDGPSASSGGALGTIALSDLVPEYSAAAAALEPGEISEVVKTSFGYHIIRLNKREGENIDTHQILISIEQEGYDEQAAVDYLNAVRDTLLNNPEVSFAAMARKHSEDSQTASRGGRLLSQNQERLIALSNLDPAMYRIVLLLEEPGDISTPKPFNTGSGNNTRSAYRIVRLDERIPEHQANFEQDYQRIENAALNNKRQQKITEWIQSMRDDVYIEYKIPVPEQLAQQTQ